MSISIQLTGLLVAFVVALLATPIVARMAIRKKWVDNPGDERMVHRRPTPRAGGLAVILAFFAGIGLFYLLSDGSWTLLGNGPGIPLIAFLIGSLAIALTGLYDDAYSLGFKKKFLFQLVVAYAMYLVGFRVEVPVSLFTDSDPYIQVALGLPLTLLWYIAVMNAVNLIDGLDGLASGVTLIAFTSLAIVFSIQGNPGAAALAFVMAGALLGFLIYNFNPASVFLGDTGSLFLGFVIATYGLAGSNGASSLLSLLIATLAIGFPLLDTTVAFVRRFVNGKSPFAPDKDHIHHRLVEHFGFSVKSAVLSLYLFNLVLGMLAISLTMVSGGYKAIIVVCAVLFIGLVLRQLGYLQVKEGIHLMRRHLVNVKQNRVPRGKWRTGENAHPALKVVQHSEARPPAQDKREKREIMVHSVE